MKKIIVVIICLLLIILLCSTFANNKKDNDENNAIQENTIIPENEIEENIITNSDVNENNVVENEVPISNNDVYKEDSDIGTTDKKEEAIELVKATWGEDSTVSFRCDSVTSNGEYIIAVISNETRTVRNDFRVNLENKSVDVDY